MTGFYMKHDTRMKWLHSKTFWTSLETLQSDVKKLGTKFFEFIGTGNELGKLVLFSALFDIPFVENQLDCEKQEPLLHRRK